VAESTDLQRLIVSLEANIKKYEKELAKANGIAADSTRRVTRDFDRMNGNISAGFSKLAAVAAAAFSVTAMVAFAKKAIEAADSIAEAAERAGVSASSFQELAYAFKLSGVNSEALEKALLQLARRAGGASEEADETSDALNKLGISVRDIQGMKPDDIFKLIADRIAAIKDPMQQATIAYALFGREGQRLLPTLRGGSIEFARLAAEAEFDRIGLALQAAGINISVGMLPALEQLRKMLTDPAMQDGAKRLGAAIGEMVTWMVNNKDTIILVASTLAGAFSGRLFGLPGAVAGAGGGFAAGLAILEKMREQTDKLKSSATSAGDAVTGVAAAITTAMKKAGFEVHQVAAALAAVERESQFDPTRLNPNDRGMPAFGLFQWRDRLPELKEFARVAGASINDVRTQVAFFFHELSNGEKKAGDMLKAAGDPEAAARAMAAFERFQGWNKEGNSELQKRIALTKQYYDILIKNGATAESGRPSVTVTPTPPFIDDRLGELMRDIALKTRIARGEFSALGDEFVEAAMKLPETRKKIIELGGDLEKMPEQIRRAAAGFKEFQRAQDLAKAADDFGKAFGRAFEDAILKAKTLEDALKALGQEIARLMLRLLVTNTLERTLRSAFLGFSGLFGGGAGPAAPALGTPRMGAPSPALAPTSRGAPAMSTMNVTINAPGADAAALERVKRSVDELHRGFNQRVGAAIHTRQVRHVRL
jgi:hypothetical protein